MKIPVAINHIELVQKRSGKFRAHLIGKRISVHDIASMVKFGNSSVEWIVENYDLTPAQVYAALSFYYDHQEMIDREIEEDEQETQALAIDAQEHLAKMRSRLPQK